VFWHLPQLQYKNPTVQIVTFRNMTPSPFIKCYYGNHDFIHNFKQDLFNVELGLIESNKQDVNNMLTVIDIFEQEHIVTDQHYTCFANGIHSNLIAAD